jgi:hypothetical protein
MLPISAPSHTVNYSCCIAFCKFTKETTIYASTAPKKLTMKWRSWHAS